MATPVANKLEALNDIELEALIDEERARVEELIEDERERRWRRIRERCVVLAPRAFGSVPYDILLSPYASPPSDDAARKGKTD
jgi:hypothetical protein